jgi:hypothetical protein
MRTQTFCMSLLAAGAVLLAAGCDEVEDRVSWSPDGSRAIVRAGNTLCLLDTNGRLSCGIAEDIAAAAWLPDSHGLVLLQSIDVTSWSEARRLLPPEEVAEAEALAKGLPALLRAGLAMADGVSTNMWDVFGKQFKVERPEIFFAAALCAHDTQSNALHQAAQTARDYEKLRADIEGIPTNKVTEIVVVSLGNGTETNASRTIVRSIVEIQQPRASSTAKSVAFIRGGSLELAPLGGSTNRLIVAEKVVGEYDWTPDGRTLVYAVHTGEKWESGGPVRIERRTVLGSKSELDTNNPAEPLAIDVATFAPRIRCLRDGRILFAGNQQSLPSSAAASQEARLYILDPAQGTNAVPVTIPSPAGALPQDLAAFAPSPDGRQIAIVESGSDAVAVLDVATGAVEVVSPKHGWKSTVLPAWRNGNELYFGALPQASSSRPELLRWSKGSAPQVVSKSWSDEAAGMLLKKSNN